VWNSKGEVLAMKTTKVAGAMLATAVALAFMSSPARAADPSSPSATKAQIKCLGANSCKGQSECKSASNDCKGQNACKGKGYVVTETVKECTARGGRVGKNPPMSM
jgi:uncharacterized membrane protein